MKKKTLAIIICILSVPFLASGERIITLPHIELINSNGVRVFYAKDTLPQCTVYISIGLGSLYENAANAGISQMLALVLSLGGSKNYPVINELVEKTGGRYSVSASFETVTITMRVHQDDADKAFAILTDIMANPLFDEKLVETARFMCKQQIQKKQDDPMTIAMEKARQIVFGDSSYGAIMTDESLNAIKSTQLQELWKQYVVKENVYVGIVTSLEKEKVVEAMNHLTKAISFGKAIDYTIDFQKVGSATKDKTIYYIEKDIPQSTIIIATVAPSIKTDDRYALEIGNYILGGGTFNSWFMNQIRVERGYAYSTGTILRLRKNVGLFIAYAQTQSKTTLETVKIMKEVISRFTNHGPSEEELQWAKNALIKSYIFEFKSLRSIVQYYMWLYFNGFNESYIDSYADEIRNVTKHTVINSYRNVLKGYVVVIVGNREVQNQLDAQKLSYTKINN